MKLTVKKLKELLEGIDDNATILVGTNLEIEVPGESPEISTGLSYLQEGELFFLAETDEVTTEELGILDRVETV